MQIQEPEIVRLIERIGEHFKTNISNRFIRPVLLQLPIDKQSWDLIEVLTEKIEQYRYQGFHFDELYRQIAVAARFVSLCRKEIVPTLRSRLSGGGSGPEKVLRDMAVNNFASNLQLFADLLNELYVKLVEIDKRESKGRIPVYKQMTELQEIGRLLVG